MIELIETFIRPLERHGFRYLVTGSVASMAYGEPRLTNDIDLILEIRTHEINSLIETFPQANYYLPPSDIIHSELARSQRGHFNMIHQETMLKADVYLIGADPLHRWALQNPRLMEIDGLQVAFAPPEYVILRKLEFFREGHSEKHLRDIAAMLCESGPHIDKSFLAGEVLTRGLTDEWQRANDMTGA